MPITSTMVAGVINAARVACPSAVVAASLSYKDDTGEVQFWSGSGTATPLLGASKFLPDGTWISDGYKLVLMIADLDPRWPKQTDLMDLRIGDDDAVTYQVRDAQPDITRTILTLTLEKRFG